MGIYLIHSDHLDELSLLICKSAYESTHLRENSKPEWKTLV